MNQRILDHLFIVLLVWIVCITVRSPLREYGDGREYIIQTQAIVLDRSLAIHTGDRSRYWNQTDPFGIALGKEAGEGFGGLYRDLFGEYRYCHFWLYSLFAAPIYAIIHLLSSNNHYEYHSFRILNCILFILPLWIVWKEGASCRKLISFLLLLITPLSGYLQWAHSEIFCFSLCFLSFYLISHKRLKFSAPILLALGAAQNIPLALFFPIHLLFFYRKNRSDCLSWKIYCVYFISILFPVGNLMYWKYYFGVWSIYDLLGAASLSYITVAKVSALFFSPMIGAVYFYPFLFFLLPSRMNKENFFVLLSLLISIISVAALSASTNNLFSAQIGAVRYAAWFLAPLVWVMLNDDWMPIQAKQERSEYAGVCVSLAIILIFHTQNLLYGDFYRFVPWVSNNREVRELYRLTHYEDDPEVLAENISHEDLHVPYNFKGVYILKLGDHTSLWLVSKRALEKMSYFRFASESIISVSASPMQNVITCEHRECSMQRSKFINFYHHPVFGHYAYLWINGDFDSIETDAPYYLR